MELWEEIKKLEGKVLKGLDQRKPFEVVKVLNTAVIVMPLSTKKERMVPKKEFEGAYRELIALGQISRNQITALYSPWNPVYVAAILAELPNVTHTIRPIILYYKSEK